MPAKGGRDRYLLSHSTLLESHLCQVLYKYDYLESLQEPWMVSHFTGTKQNKTGRKRLWLVQDKEITLTLSTESRCLLWVLNAFKSKVGWPRGEEDAEGRWRSGEGTSSACKLCDQSTARHTQRQHRQAQLCPTPFQMCNWVSRSPPLPHSKLKLLMY